VHLIPDEKQNRALLYRVLLKNQPDFSDSGVEAEIESSFKSSLCASCGRFLSVMYGV
jgi:NMD protein affecting ribosome stability and mRNA decay